MQDPKYQTQLELCHWHLDTNSENSVLKMVQTNWLQILQTHSIFYKLTPDPTNSLQIPQTHSRFYKLTPDSTLNN